MKNIAITMILSVVGTGIYAAEQPPVGSFRTSVLVGNRTYVSAEDYPLSHKELVKHYEGAIAENAQIIYNLQHNVDRALQVVCQQDVILKGQEKTLKASKLAIKTLVATTVGIMGIAVYCYTLYAQECGAPQR